MTGFTVDTSRLQTLSKNLGSIEENVNHAVNRIKEHTSDTLGTDELNDVCRDFAYIWRGGLEQIQESMGNVRERLDQAATLYNTTDLEVKKRLETVGR